MLKKKIAMLILPLIVCALVFICNGEKMFVTASSGTTGDCEWVLEDGVLTISGNGEMENYTYSYPESPAPWGAAITKVVIEEGVTSIGDYAFFGCSSLTSVELPEGLTNIGKQAFAYCYRLTSIELPDSLTSIGSAAFEGYGGTTIELPEGLTSIGNGAFCYSSLTSIKIPRGITNIESNTFVGCYDLVSIELPEGLTSIGYRAFHECISLTSIEIPGSVTFIGDDAFCYCNNAIIYGYTGSYAEEYAMTNGISFVALDAVVENPFTDVYEGLYYYEPVLWAFSNGVTAGISETEFGPETTCTRGQIVTFLWRALGRPASSLTSNPFVDVPSGIYYEEAVLWAYENGITSGVSATEFGPEETCTRAQIVTFLWRAFGRPEAGTTTNPFADVPAGMYYTEAVLWAVENGITSGISETEFGPEASCTRGQVVSFLYRAYVE